METAARPGGEGGGKNFRNEEKNSLVWLASIVCLRELRLPIRSCLGVDLLEASRSIDAILRRTILCSPVTDNPTEQLKTSSKILPSRASIASTPVTDNPTEQLKTSSKILPSRASIASISNMLHFSYRYLHNFP
ncbi:hypothetical protein QE152_g33195 [Popillia japonica]|uniref:Uncharacterized protein n=1 Tax=Popillia japonica TaxID=7064 RepID=A0AAW1IXK0_POPJA